MHIVFVKATWAKRLADTVFFKHKYITQPTVTPADAIVNAYHKLVQAIQGTQHITSDAHLKALECLQDNLMSGNQYQTIPAPDTRLPRVKKQTEPELTQTTPKV